jgi:hypothetical protein
MQVAGHDEPIAAIVAAAANDTDLEVAALSVEAPPVEAQPADTQSADTKSLGDARQDPLCHDSARTLHEEIARHAQGLDGVSVERSHVIGPDQGPDPIGDHDASSLGQE